MGEGYLAVVSLIPDQAGDPDPPAATEGGRTALQAAGGAGHTDVVLSLLRAGAEVNVARRRRTE